MYVIAGKRSHHAGMYGTYREDPEAAIGIATAAMSKLYVYATKKRMNSMTATDFMVG